VLLFGFGNDGVKVREDFGNGDGVNLAAGVVAFFDQLFEVTAGNLDGKLVGDDLAGAFFLFDPRGAGQSDPHGTAIYVKTDIDGVGVARGDGHDVGLPRAVQVFAGPSIGHMEVFVHVPSLSPSLRQGKRPDHVWWRWALRADKLTGLQWLCPHLYGPACKLIEAKDKTPRGYTDSSCPEGR